MFKYFQGSGRNQHWLWHCLNNVNKLNINTLKIYKLFLKDGIANLYIILRLQVVADMFLVGLKEIQCQQLNGMTDILMKFQYGSNKEMILKSLGSREAPKIIEDINVFLGVSQ